MSYYKLQIGRTRTALVFGQAQTAKAVIATVTGRVRRRCRRRRLTYVGPVRLDPTLSTHLRTVILPAVDAILKRLGIASTGFGYELSFVNLAVASVAGLRLSLSGHSADLAVTMTMISAALGIPLRQDVVLSGHVASPDGDVEAVCELAAKLVATVGYRGISRFVTGALDSDNSVKVLAPERREEALSAILGVRNRLEVVQVADLAQVLPTVISEDAIVLAALRHDFFETPNPEETAESAVERAAIFLGGGNEGRFWHSLEGHLQTGQVRPARDLLRARVRYQIKRKRWPTGFGSRFCNLLASLPPIIRRTRLTFPLLEMEAYLPLCRLATSTDPGDAQRLMDALAGHFVGRNTACPPAAEGSSQFAANTVSVVEALIGQISDEHLAREISCPIATARATYLLPDLVVESNEAFNETITAFYLHLLRHCNMEPLQPNVHYEAEALALVERAFSRDGGASAAWAEARDPTRRGGLCFVLDRVTRQFDSEQILKLVDCVFGKFEALSWAEKVAFMQVFRQHIWSRVPGTGPLAPAEELALEYRSVLETHVQMLNHLRGALRRFKQE